MLGILLLVILVVGCAAPSTPKAGAALPIGTITQVSDTELEVSCPDIPDIHVVLRVTGEGTAGTILLTTGHTGQSFYRTGGEFTTDEGYTGNMMDELLDNGYRLVEVRWREGGHWELPEEPEVGSISLSCRFATVAHWAYENLHVQGIFGAQGNSGGSAQIGFGLAYYGLEDILDVANLGGGPPPCPISSGGKTNPAEQPQCLGGNEAEYISNEPILSGTPDLEYPDTVVNFFLGEDEPSQVAIVSANAFHDAIASAKSIQTVPNTGHPVHHTEEGTAALLAKIREAAGQEPKSSH